MDDLLGWWGGWVGFSNIRVSQQLNKTWWAFEGSEEEQI
jgi:hypothetical protein